MKKSWVVTAPGYKPFPMILLSQAMDHVSALALARSIWPICEVS